MTEAELQGAKIQVLSNEPQTERHSFVDIIRWSKEPSTEQAAWNRADPEKRGVHMSGEAANWMITAYSSGCLKATIAILGV